MRDIFRRFSSDTNGFGVNITWYGTPDEPLAEPIVVAGFTTDHFTSYDEDGMKVGTRTASLAVAETLLTETANGAFVVRDGNGDLKLLRHIISTVDIDNRVRKSIITETWPDAKLGCIVLKLAEYASN